MPTEREIARDALADVEKCLAKLERGGMPPISFGALLRKVRAAISALDNERKG